MTLAPNPKTKVNTKREGTGFTGTPRIGGIRPRAIGSPDSADIPTGERAVRRELLHLLRDFSQSAILRHMSGNSADISKGYFEKPIGSLNPLWSASKSLI
jgi:hypothetical protein